MLGSFLAFGLAAAGPSPLLAAFGATPSPPAAQNLEEANRAFAEGSQAFSAGNYELALGDFSRSYAFSHVAKLLFAIAECQLALQHWEEAASSYDRYLAAAPGGKSRPQAIAHLADARQKMGEAATSSNLYDAALAQFRTAYELVPNGERLYRVAESERLLGRWAQARDDYQRYLNEYPSGPWRAAAQRGQETAQAELARQEVQPPPEVSKTVVPASIAESVHQSAPPAQSHPRPLALAVGGAAIAGAALGVVGLAMALGVQRWNGRPPGSTVVDPQSGVNTINLGYTLAFIGGGTLVGGGVLTAVSW